MKSRRFNMVDVFGAEPPLGNPLAVVVDAAGLSDEAMQRFARWTNLSETSFLLPPSAPEADYRLRIFTPYRELPFAGHPTLGSAHAWLETGATPRHSHRIVQECAAGLVEIRRDASALSFAAPPLRRSGPLEAELLEDIARVLRVNRRDILDHQWVDNGPGWAAVRLASADAVLELEPDFSAMHDLELGVVGAHPAGAPCQFELRAFISKDVRIPYEDPVTGSLNGSVAQWLFGAGLAMDAYSAAQGTALGRAGLVHLERDASGQVWVGGAAVTLVEGTVTV